MKLTEKQRLESILQKQVEKQREQAAKLTERLQRIDDTIREKYNNKKSLGMDFEFCKKRIQYSAAKSYQAKLLKFSRANRFLRRPNKYDISKITEGPQHQYKILLKQNYSSFRNEVRMSREAFFKLLDMIEKEPEYLYKGIGRRQMPCKVQLMIALNRLGSSGTGGTYSAVARRYSIGGK